jgi:hypothetical protein
MKNTPSIHASGNARRYFDRGQNKEKPSLQSVCFGGFQNVIWGESNRRESLF